MDRRFCVPARFDEVEFDAYDQINAGTTDARIWEVYGGLSPDPFGSGRSPQTLPAVSPARLAEYVQTCNSRGYRFNYVFNASCIGARDFTTRGRKDLLRFVESIASCGVSSITLALPTAIEMVARYFPELEIAASVILRIDSSSKAQAYAELGARRLILFEDLNRDFATLSAIRSTVDVDLEIMVNSPCLFSCAFREFHYTVQSHSHGQTEVFDDADAWFSRCNLLKLEHPEELLRARGLVRPEDLRHYTSRGIKYFKIVGREAVMDNLLVSVSAYTSGKFNGNVFDLLPRPKGTIQAYELSNRLLDGFIDPFLEGRVPCTTGCRDCGYCDSFAKEMILAVTPKSLKNTLSMLAERTRGQ